VVLYEENLSDLVSRWTTNLEVNWLKIREGIEQIKRKVNEAKEEYVELENTKTHYSINHSSTLRQLVLRWYKLFEVCKETYQHQRQQLSSFEF